jgi:hypothetical protein
MLCRVLDAYVTSMRRYRRSAQRARIRGSDLGHSTIDEDLASGHEAAFFGS